jgi:hypothetical protein
MKESVKKLVFPQTPRQNANRYVERRRSPEHHQHPVFGSTKPQTLRCQRLQKDERNLRYKPTLPIIMHDIRSMRDDVLCLIHIEMDSEVLVQVLGLGCPNLAGNMNSTRFRDRLVRDLGYIRHRRSLWS